MPERPDEQLQQLDDEIKRLREQQKPLSRKIGQAKAVGETADEFLSDMRALSSRIKHLSADRKKLNPTATVDVAPDAVPHKPAYFQQESSAIANANHSTSKADSIRNNNFYDSRAQQSPESSSRNYLPESIEECTDQKAWDTFVSEHAAATTYHRFGFIEFVKDQHALTVYPLAARNEAGSINGVLPIVHMKSGLFGSFLVSLPYVNYGGVLANDSDTATKLMSASQSLAEHLGCSHTEIRETHERNAWYCRKHKASMTRALPTTGEAFDKEIGAKLRSQSRKALNHDAEFRAGGIELINDFYTVFSTNMRDLGTPIYRASFFSNLLDTLGDDAFIVVVYVGGKPVASGFLIAHGETLEIPWASCLRYANKYDANMFMYRNILATAIHRQFKFFDFGRSTISGPTYRFKKQWGAVQQQLYWHYWLSNPDEPPGLNPDNPKFRLVIAIWRRLPVIVTRVIGPLIAKHLP